jgi:hypothetical protein
VRTAAPLLALALAVLAPAAARAQGTSVRGSGLAGVVTDFADRRLVGASVIVESDSATAISDRRGEFRVRGLPAGPRRFFVRRVGYEPVLFEVALPPGAIVTVHVRLQENAVSIGTMVIEGERHSLPLFREGFYDRAARHPQGWFFPPEEIVRRRLTTVTSLLSEVPGVTINRRSGESYAAGRGVGTGPCPFDIWLDGTRVQRGINDLELLAPAPLVRAVEVYPSNASVPARFVRNNSLCGALVIWTKGVVQEMF